MGLNELLDMTDSVNPNAVSLHSADFLLLLIKIDTISTDALELCLTCLSYQPKSSSLSTRSVPFVTTMTTSQVNLE